MSFAPTLDLHPENHFQFAPNTDSKGCCWCWRSKTNEYLVNEQYKLEGRKKCVYEERIQSNIRLCELIKLKLGRDPIVANHAFELLKARIDLSNGDPITSEKLAKVISAIYELKAEINVDSIQSREESKKEEIEVTSGKKKRRRKAKKAKTEL